MRGFLERLKILLPRWPFLEDQARNRHAPHFLDQRRARRIGARISVLLYGREGGVPFHEQAWTINVSARGAFARVNSQVTYAQKLVLTNLVTNEDILCRVTRLVRTESGKLLAGFEFFKPRPQFWRVALTAVNAAKTGTNSAGQYRRAH